MAQHLPYRVLLRSQGPAFSVLAFIGRLPAGILPLALLVLANQRLGSFALAGLMSAALSLGGAAGAVPVGYLADRLGHRATGVFATGVQTAGLVGFVLTCRPDLPLPLPVVLAFVTGTANPQIGAMARARWSQAAALRADRAAFTNAAMAWEGAVDEVAFVLGPVLATTVAAVSIEAPLWLVLALAWAGQVGFALHRTALPPAHQGRHRHVESPQHVRWAVLVPLMVAVAGVGVLFGGSQTSIAAHFTLAGNSAVAGIVYGALAVGSSVTGLLSNRLPGRFALGARVTAFGAATAVVSPLLVAATDAVPMALACLLIGLAIGPVLIAAFALAERIAPPERLSTVMTVLSTAVVIGVAAGAAAAGPLIDAYRPSVAAWLATAGAVVVAVGGLVVARREQPS